MLKGISRRLGSRDARRQKEFNWYERNKELIALINAREIDKALVLGQELLEYVDKKYRKDSREKATTYNNMGMVFLLARDYMLAEKCFQEALEMRKRLFGEKHNEVAVILLNLVQLYKAQAQEIFMENRVEIQE